jgi:hypothetical protein
MRVNAYFNDLELRLGLLSDQPSMMDEVLMLWIDGTHLEIGPQ